MSDKQADGMNKGDAAIAAADTDAIVVAVEAAKTTFFDISNQSQALQAVHEFIQAIEDLLAGKEPKVGNNTAAIKQSIAATIATQKDKIKYVLLFAAISLHATVVNALLAAGADITVFSEDKLPKIEDASNKDQVAKVLAVLAVILEHALAQDATATNTLAAKIIERNKRPLQGISLLDFFKHLSEAGKNYLLLFATNTADMQILNAIIDQVDINAQDQHGNTALMLAILQDNIKFFGILLEHGSDVNMQNKAELTALMQAVLAKNHTIIAALINNMAATKLDMNKRDQNGETALMHAVLQADYNTMIMLIANHVRIDEQNIRGETALMLAAKTLQAQHAHILSGLLIAQADPEKRDLVGQTALMLAASHANLAAVSTLINFKAAVNAADKKGNTALMLAAADPSGLIEIVQTLLTAGAQVGMKNIAGKTAADLATAPQIQEALKKELAGLSHVQGLHFAARAPVAGAASDAALPAVAAQGEHPSNKA